jgi:hypothetical protein
MKSRSALGLTEAQIENKFVKYAESRGVKALKLRLENQNGWPDRTVITPNGIFFIEFKTVRGRTRPMQELWRRVLVGMGFTVLTPRQAGDAEQFLAEWLGK